MSRKKPSGKPASITSSIFVLDDRHQVRLNVNYGSGSYAGQTQELEFTHVEPAQINNTTHSRLTQLNGYSDELEVSIRRIIASHPLREKRYNIQWENPTEERQYLKTQVEKLKKLREAFDAVNPQLRMERVPELDDEIQEREQHVDKLTTKIRKRGRKPDNAAVADTMSKIAEMLQRDTLSIKDGNNIPAPDISLPEAVNLARDIMTAYGVELPEGNGDSEINFIRLVENFRVREHGRVPVDGQWYDHITAVQMHRKLASDNGDT